MVEVHRWEEARQKKNCNMRIGVSKCEQLSKGLNFGHLTITCIILKVKIKKKFSLILNNYLLISDNLLYHYEK
jgi:hypothetical protein